MTRSFPVFGAVLYVGAILSSCAGDVAPESDEAFANSNATVGAATAALMSGSSGNACIRQEVGGNPPCTANDVRVGSLTLISGPTTCDPMDPTPFTVTLEAIIESGPDRFDIGLWVNESGGSAKDDPGGTCYRDYLPPPLSANGCEQDGGPYYDGDGDQCGDVYAQNTDPCGTAVTGPCSDGSGGTCLFTTRQFTVDIVCVDSNDNGTADAGTCTSWDNNDRTTCNGVLDTDPGTGSKCSCDPVEIIGLFTGCMTNEDCDDGVACTDDVCTIEGNTGECFNTPNNDNCSGDQCNDGVCDPVNDCQLDPLPNSTPCEDGLFCTSFGGVPGDADHCFDGTCTGEPVDCDDGLFCTGTESCNEETDMCDSAGDPCSGAECNTCQEDADNCVDPADTPCGSDTDNGCNLPDTCDGAGTCVDNFEPTTTTCDDGLFCTSTSGEPGATDNCNGEGNETGACVINPVDCNDGMFCTGMEVCNEMSNACVSSGDPCPGTECNTCQEDTDTCFDPAPTSCGSTTDNGCNTPDTCDGAGTCKDNFNPTTTTCDDGLFCTSTSGEPGTTDNCNGEGNETGACVGNPVDCDDGAFCSGPETCNEGTDMCDSSGDPCPGTECNTCQEDTDTCFDPAPTPCGSTTDNGCNTPDTCDGAGTCKDNFNPTTTTCDDGLFCTSTSGEPGTTDNCNGEGNETGACVGNPVDCDDGAFCSGPETCNEGTDMCDSSGDPCPGTECNTCQEGTDSCFDPAPTPCGSPEDTDCNNPDTCDGAGTCDDNFEPMETMCEDGLFCTSTSGDPGTPDNCNGLGNGGADCVGMPVDCDDGLFCSGPETCDEDANECVSTSDPCPDDEVFCNGTESCDETGDLCVSSGDPCSGEECNTCQEDTESCFDPADTPCGSTTDNGCNTPDNCDGEGTCVDNFEPTTTTCDDGFFCTSTSGEPGTTDNCNGEGNETGACVSMPVDCGDDNFCTADSCNEDSDACESDNVCTCELTKTCQVVPDPGPFDCSDAKPIDCLTMVWDGAGSVASFTAWDGDVGSTELTDVTISGGDNIIDPGDEVTVCGMGGSPNDQQWEVDGQVSEFHISCSDNEMNGAEDCGNPAGDGKSDDPSFLNDWLFEGMTGSGGMTLDCTPTPPAPSNNCEFVDQPVDCDSTGDPDFLTWRYTGGGCAATDNQQEPGKHVCTETGGVIDGASPILITDKNGTTTTLNPDDEVTFTRSDSGEITLTQGGIEEFNEIHVSCSQPLVAGDVYGSLTLVALDGQRAGRDVLYSYDVTYTNPLGFPATDIVVTDDPLGVIGTIAELSSGDTATLTKTARIEETTTNVAFASSLACNAGPATATVTVTEGCDVCKGGTTDLVFEYLGTDDAIPGEQADVVVYDDGSANASKILFQGLVTEGNQIPIMERPGQSKLNNDISIYVDGVFNVEVHTSCSQPIGPGLIVGDFQIVEGRSVDNGLMCPLNTCDLDAAVNLEFSGKEARWTLTNNGDANVIIERITIDWPNGNGILTEIKRDGDTIHKGNFQPTSAVIDSGWEGNEGKRTVKAGDTDTLKFKFVHDASLTGDYAITVEFDQGCSIMVSVP